MSVTAVGEVVEGFARKYVPSSPLGNWAQVLNIVAMTLREKVLVYYALTSNHTIRLDRPRGGWLINELRVLNLTIRAMAIASWQDPLSAETRARRIRMELNWTIEAMSGHHLNEDELEEAHQLILGALEPPPEFTNAAQIDELGEAVWGLIRVIASQAFLSAGHAAPDEAMLQELLSGLRAEAQLFERARSSDERIGLMRCIAGDLRASLVERNPGTDLEWVCDDIKDILHLLATGERR